MGRLIISFVVVAVATVVALLALTANWVRNVGLDTSAWGEISGELLADPQVRDAVAMEVASQAGTSDPALAQGVSDALAEPDLEPLWVDATESAHALLVAVVDEDAAAGSLGTDGSDGTLQLDLTPLADRIAADAGLPPGSLGDAIGLQVVTADELETLRGTGDLIDATAIGSLVATVVLYGLALVIAPPGRRRAAALGVGVSLIAVGALALLARSASAESAVDELAASHPTRDAVERAWLIGTDGLAGLATILIVVGSVAVAAVIVTGAVTRRRPDAYA